jgi:hypothetical protein
MSVMGVFSKKWRKRGLVVYIYRDNILVLNTAKKGVEKDLKIVLEDLSLSGMLINEEKMCVRTPIISPLEFTLNLREGLLEVPQGKMKSMRKELGKLSVKKTMTCRKKNGFHFGNIKIFNGNPTCKMVHRSPNALCPKTTTPRLGCPSRNFKFIKTRSEILTRLLWLGEGDPFKRGNYITFRFINPWMGGDRPLNKGCGPRILENPKWGTHK